MKSGTEQKHRTDIIVNAAGYGARVISQELGLKPFSHLQLRFFNDITVTRRTQELYPFPFVIVPGEIPVMHWIPLRDNVVSLTGRTFA